MRCGDPFFFYYFPPSFSLLSAQRFTRMVCRMASNGSFDRQHLSLCESHRLIEWICYARGEHIERSEFAESVLNALEDVPGFEAMLPEKGEQIVQQLWSLHMSKKTQKPDAAETSTAHFDAPVESENTVDLSAPKIQQAIADGRSLIDEGKSKADAARAIHAALRNEGKDVIVAAFMAGATLTPKGAITYWYNCERRAAKEARKG